VPVGTILYQHFAEMAGLRFSRLLAGAGELKLADGPDRIANRMRLVDL